MSPKAALHSGLLGLWVVERLVSLHQCKMVASERKWHRRSKLCLQQTNNKTGPENSKVYRQRTVLTIDLREDFSYNSFYLLYLRGGSQNKRFNTVHPMTKYFWCSDAKIGSPACCLNCVPSEQQDRGSMSMASQQAALLGSQHHKIAPRVKLCNRLQFSQENGGVRTDKVTAHNGPSFMVGAPE